MPDDRRAQVSGCTKGASQRLGRSYTGRVRDEASYICDSCGEDIVVPIDWSAGSRQSYVEDCPVCCNPNVIHVELDDGEAYVRSEPEQDR